MTQSKRKFKFNILDVLIIAVIIAVGISVVIRYDLTEKLGLQSAADTFEVTFIVKNIQQKSEQYFTDGAKFYIESNQKEFGDLKEILDISIAKQYQSTLDGKIVYSEIPNNRIDVTGIITCKGIINAQGYMVGGTTAIAPGKDVTIRSNKLTNMTITITDITEVK